MIEIKVSITSYTVITVSLVTIGGLHGRCMGTYNVTTYIGVTMVDH